MKRTYGGRRGTAGSAAGGCTLDYRDILQTLDNTTVFDALSIKNLKQLKRETNTSYATWSNQQQRSVRKSRKKKLVKKVQNKHVGVVPLSSFESSITEAPLSSCLTPDKSLRVNRAPDPFDQLCAQSPQNNLRVRKTDNDLFDQILHRKSPSRLDIRPDKEWSFDRQINDSQRKNIIHNESHIAFNSIKENDMNASNSSVKCSNETQNESSYNSCIMLKHKFNVDYEQVNNNKSLKHCIGNIVDNMKLLQNVRKTNSPDKNTTLNKSQSDNNSIRTIEKEPQTSTPNLKRIIKKYSVNVSPICSNRTRVPIISIISATPVQTIDNDTIDNSVDNIIGDITNIKGYEPSDVQSNISENTSNYSVNVAEKVALEISGKSNNEKPSVHISLLPESFDGEPFLGFTNYAEISRNYAEISRTHTINDLFNSIEDNNRGETTCTIHCNESKRNDSANETDIKPNKQLNKNETSNSSCVSESNKDSDSYETCSSKSDNIQMNKHKEVRVCVDRLRDSLFYEYYKNVNNFNESSNTLSSQDDLSVQNYSQNTDELLEDYMRTDIENYEEAHISTTKSSKNSQSSESLLGNSSVVNVISRTSVLIANEDDYRESISISSDSNYTDTPEKKLTCYKLDTSTSLSSSYTSSTKSSHSEIARGPVKDVKEKMDNFVTTRRGNDFNDDSVIILDDSVENSPVKRDTTEHLNKMTCQYEHVDQFNDVNVENRNIKPDSFNIKSNLSNNLITGNEYQCLNISPNKPESSNNLSRHLPLDTEMGAPSRPSIALLPGKKWERSLSVYRRQTMLQASILDNTTHEELIDKSKLMYKFNAENRRGTYYPNDSVCDRRESVASNPRRSTIRIVKEAVSERASLSVPTILEDDIGFLSENCDDTLCDISRLSLSDSRLDVTVLEKRQESARDILLRRCKQADVLPFDECYPDSVLKNCRKIGEGVYGEVFLYRGEDGRGRVMKVVPVQGQLRVNGEQQKTFQEVISEVIIAMELSALRAPIAEIAKHCNEESDVSLLELPTAENATDTFNEVLAVRCVRGTYPARLLDLWELYDETNGSENDNPDALPPDQQYVVLELANAGQDLESYQFNNAEQAHALFYQVAFALAVGEEAYQFEHRDLHWGNVLIQPTDQKFGQYLLRGRLHTVPRCGVAATIIDYTLSRVTLPLAAGDRAALFNDLAHDEGLFHAVGDYQFDVYRHMREKTGNDWKKFEPYTNILWLHYTVDKMITALRYKRTNTKVHKHYIAKLKGIKNRLLDYGSAVQFVLTDNDL